MDVTSATSQGPGSQTVGRAPVPAPASATSTPPAAAGKAAAPKADAGQGSQRQAPAGAAASRETGRESPFARQALNAYRKVIQAQDGQASRRLSPPPAPPRIAAASLTQSPATTASASGAAAPAAPGLGRADTILINTRPQGSQGPFAQIPLPGGQTPGGRAAADTQSSVRLYRANAETVARYASGKSGVADAVSLAA